MVPGLIYDNVGEAIAWLCAAFGFRERLRQVGRDGVIGHAQLDVGECALMLGRQGGEFRVPRPGEVSQYVHVRNPSTSSPRSSAIKRHLPPR